jgi:membrane associated rhomboid family serine protease
VGAQYQQISSGCLSHIQLISGIGSIANTTESGGVAYMAHIGGFVAGLLFVKPMTVGRLAATARNLVPRVGEPTPFRGGSSL